MERFVEMVKLFARKQEGQDLVEYAMLLGLIALICVGAVTALGVNIQGVLSAISTAALGA